MTLITMMTMMTTMTIWRKFRELRWNVRVDESYSWSVLKLCIQLLSCNRWYLRLVISVCESRWKIYTFVTHVSFQHEPSAGITDPQFCMRRPLFSRDRTTTAPQATLLERCAIYLPFPIYISRCNISSPFKVTNIEERTALSAQISIVIALYVNAPRVDCGGITQLLSCMEILYPGSR